MVRSVAEAAAVRYMDEHSQTPTPGAGVGPAPPQGVTWFTADSAPSTSGALPARTNVLAVTHGLSCIFQAGDQALGRQLQMLTGLLGAGGPCSPVSTWSSATAHQRTPISSSHEGQESHTGLAGPSPAAAGAASLARGPLIIAMAGSTASSACPFLTPPPDRACCHPVP